MNAKRHWLIGAIVGCLLATSWTSTAMASADNPKTHDHNKKAKVCYFDHIKYTNKGSYVMQGLELFFVDYQGRIGKYNFDIVSELTKDVVEGSNMTANLDKVAGNALNAGPTGPLKDRMEVWPRISILLGDTKDCHKDGHKLVYAKGSKRTLHFQSSGSTTKNNRCEYAENMANQCDSSVPPKVN